MAALEAPVILFSSSGTTLRWILQRASITRAEVKARAKVTARRARTEPTRPYFIFPRVNVVSNRLFLRLSF